MVVDIASHVDHAEAYVRVSGEGDYVEGVEYLQGERGIRVEVISGAQCTSQALRGVWDMHTDLAEIPDLFREKATGFSHQASGKVLG